MESDRRIFRSRAENGTDSNKRVVWQHPTPPGISRTLAASGRRPGPREQRRIFDGALRNSGARFVPEQNVSRWAGWCGVWAISAARERGAEAGRMAVVLHRVSRAENQREHRGEEGACDG